MKCQIAACNVLVRLAIAKAQSKLLSYLKWVSQTKITVFLLTTALEWLDATITAFIECYQVSIESQHGPGPFGTMQVDLRLQPPFEHDVVSDNQIHRVQLPAMREDFLFVWESSNLDGVMDAILSADAPLCMAPKRGSYDLSVYEVGSRRLFGHFSHTDPEIFFSVFVDVFAPACRCCVAQTPALSTGHIRMTIELFT